MGLKIKTIGWISNTRWNFWYNNCEALKKCFKSILSVLKMEIENEADRDVNEAIGLMSYYILTLCMMYNENLYYNISYYLFIT